MCSENVYAIRDQAPDIDGYNEFEGDRPPVSPDQEDVMPQDVVTQHFAFADDAEMQAELEEQVPEIHGELVRLSTGVS